jgi:carbon-monoxide dehydrogenase medium subunit
MFPVPFAYHDPATLDEALALLAERAPDARPLAGGQSLVAAMNLGIARPEVVVDLRRVAGLAEIVDEGAWLRIGAMARQSDLERSAHVRRACPLLAEAAGLVGNARVRARGTLGGSLAHADPFAELPAVALTLGAALVIASARGRRVVPADAFFLAPLTTALAPDELLVEVRLPPLAPGAGWAIEEIARRPGGYATAGVAVVVTLALDATCSSIRLACFGAGPTLRRASPVEALLIGAPLDDGRIDTAARALVAEAAGQGQPDYATRMLAVVCRRAVARARDRARARHGASP